MIYAEVIGDPIAQSKSPAIHRFWLDRLGIAANYRACHVTADGLAGYLAQRRQDPDWRGCNVTMPHKQAIVSLLDGIDDAAAAIGAVNTVVREEGGRLIGYNTDAGGFFEPLRAMVPTDGDRFAYVIGSGGAARAIVAALYAEHFLIWSISRDPARARAALGSWIGEDPDFYVALGDLPAGSPRAADPTVFSVVVNATSLGMAGQPPLAIGWGGFLAGTVAYDIVTTPPDTAFLQAARGHGMTTIDGLAMLISQAALAFEKFFGQAAPRSDDAVLRSGMGA